MERVCVGYIHPGQVDTHFHHSLMSMVLHDKANRGRLTGYLAEETPSGMIAWGRNGIVKAFLAGPADWLFMIDTDMGFEPNTIERMLQSADREKRPIMGGLAFGHLPVKDSKGTLGDMKYRRIPTIMRYVPATKTLDGSGKQTPPSTTPMEHYPRDAVIECDATGAACLLVHRRVFEAMRKKFPAPMHWFDNMTIDGRWFGEDITFCLRAKALGFPVHVDTSVKTSHRKITYLVEESCSSSPESVTPAPNGRLRSSPGSGTSADTSVGITPAVTRE